MTRRAHLSRYVVESAFFLALVGCSSSPGKFQAPDVDVDAAAAQALELYDKDRNGQLSDEELSRCPGILIKLAAYDKSGDKSVSQDEIRVHLAELFKNGVGGTQLNCLVTFNGKPLAGAEVLFEPEPFLGQSVQAARGVTNGSGAAQLGIPPEFLPPHLQRLKAVHYGVFTVRVTHPTIAIPKKYNVESELGYETEPGKATTTFELRG